MLFRSPASVKAAAAAVAAARAAAAIGKSRAGSGVKASAVAPVPGGAGLAPAPPPPLPLAALFSKYGYRVAPSASGLLMRRQYFSPFSILKAIPYYCQVVLGGQPLTEFTEENETYWSDPFKITIENGYANMVLRSVSFSLPLSEDPTVPLARILQYAPPKYRWRPNLETAFQLRRQESRALFIQ